MKRELLLKLPFGGLVGRCALTTVAMVSISGGSCRAVPVDVEWLFMMDTSVFVSGQNFSDTLESFAQSFEDPDMISTIQSGANGSIAASLMLFSGPGSQAMTVPWMSISDAASAQAFAAALRASPRPFANFTTSFVNAFGFATPQFGDETGGPANGFESTTQMINITSESFLLPSEPPAAVQAASSAAGLSGVDVINAMVVGTFNQAGATTFYTNNVTGGGASGTPGTVGTSPNYATLPANALISLNNQVGVAIPESSALLLLPLGAALLARRQRT